MWPSLNAEGKVVYRLGILEAAGQKEINAEIVLKENDKNTFNLSLTEVLGSRFFHGDIYQHNEVNGIPVLTLKRFPSWLPDSPAFKHRDHALMQDFFMDAYELRGEKALIFDLRAHGGGDTNQGYSWIRNFTDSLFDKPAHIKASLMTKTAQKLRMLRMDRGGHPLYDFYEFYEKVAKPSESGWLEIGYRLPEFVENETVIIVLTGKNTASGGERFVDALRHLENVVVIGTNTMGCSLGDSTTTQLPNSHIRINVGVSIKLPLDLTDREGIGLLPDLWVPPTQALDLAVKFIHNYVQ